MAAMFFSRFQVIARLAACLALASLFSGCASTSTRSVPVTVLDSRQLEIPGVCLGKPIYFSGLDTSSAEIKITHHEGVLQAEQFWIAGPTKAQKKILRESAIVLANNGFIAELMAQGLGLRSPPEVAEDVGDAVELKARLQKMVIKTYGRGFGGFGSAGDYWECYLYLDGLQLAFPSAPAGGCCLPAVEGYAKVKGSPVKLGGLIEGMVWMAKVSTNPLMAAMPNYSVQQTAQSPVELSARIAARKFLGQFPE